jgi:uncharacterized protein (DUF2236 family)
VVSLTETRHLGEQFVTDTIQSARSRVQRDVRRSLGVRGTPPPICDDPDLSYLPVDGAARVVHSDLSSMLIGGIASLLLQLLHPEVMAGVAQHSRYQEDPLGRLARTASFVGTTTFGSARDAATVIERVRAVHRQVHGVSTDGVAYRADDPALLEWVHVTEVAMFLAGARAYGPRRLSNDVCDRYVREMATLARDLGVDAPPRTVLELDEHVAAYRPRLRLTSDGRTTRDFLLRGVSRTPAQRVAYTTMVVAAVGILPPWARRQLSITTLPFADALMVRPTATLLCSTLRLAVPPRSSRREGQASVDGHNLAR